MYFKIDPQLGSRSPRNLCPFKAASLFLMHPLPPLPALRFSHVIVQELPAVRWVKRRPVAGRGPGSPALAQEGSRDAKREPVKPWPWPCLPSLCFHRGDIRSQEERVNCI